MPGSSGDAQRLAAHPAIVTGGAAGIGAAVARRLAQEGAGVVVVDVSGAGHDVVASIEESGDAAVFVRADVRSEDEWRRIVAVARERFGPIQVLINNAADYEVRAAHDLSAVEWAVQLEACLTTAFLGVRACLPDLLVTGGNVVMVSSVHAHVGLPGHPAYAAAKAGLLALARQLAVEYGPAVRVNAVTPGPILTPRWDGLDLDARRASAAATALSRLGSPEEVAAAVAFLASSDASYVTGSELRVDGGWSITKSSS